MAVGTLDVGKKGSKKSFFFLNGPALYPPPTLNGLAIKKKIFSRLFLFLKFLSYDLEIFSLEVAPPTLKWPGETKNCCVPSNTSLNH